MNKPLSIARSSTAVTRRCAVRGIPGAIPRARSTGLARLHVIFFDNTLSHVASLLKVGVMQLLLCLIEVGDTKPGLLLDDPLTALWRWSRDPSLKTTAPLMSGTKRNSR